MSRSPDRLSFILLALLLAFSPLQNVIAGLDSHMAVQKGLPGMTDTESGGMSMHGHQGMNADCQHCVEYDQTGCDGHGCSQTHCTACFPGLLSTTKLTLTTTSADSYPVFDQVFSNRYSSHPFRPPKT